VLSKTGDDVCSVYAKSLLYLSTNRVSLLSPTAFAYGESNVRERVANVLHFKKPAKWVVVVSIAAMILFTAGFASNRAMAIDVQAVVRGGASSRATVFNITDWHTNSIGYRVADDEVAQEIGMAILNDYFPAFRHDWENWDDLTMTLTAGTAVVDQNGVSHTPPWHGRVPDGVGGGYFFSPPFIFYIDAETGSLDSASIFPAPDYITTDLSPFAISFEEALEIHGDWWYETLPISLRSEYKDALIQFSLGLLEENGFAADAGVFADVVEERGNFNNSHVNVEVNVVFADGPGATLNFWVFESRFTVLRLELYYN